MDISRFSFWRWFLCGSGGRAGVLRLVDPWLLVHTLVGVALTITVPVSTRTAANAVLLPLAGIFIGLSFAWGGNAQALLQTSEMEEISKYHEGGYMEYVFVYQTAILIILTSLVLWGLAGLNIFDSFWPTTRRPRLYFLVRWILFTASSITLRECWHVVLGAQWMLLAQRELKIAEERETEDAQEHIED